MMLQKSTKEKVVTFTFFLDWLANSLSESGIFGKSSTTGGLEPDSWWSTSTGPRSSRSEPACRSDVTRDSFWQVVGGGGAGLAFFGLRCLAEGCSVWGSFSSSFSFLCRRKKLMAPSMVKGGLRCGRRDCINKVDRRVCFLTCSGTSSGWWWSSWSGESLPSSSQHSVVDSALWISSSSSVLFRGWDAMETVGGVEADCSIGQVKY